MRNSASALCSNLNTYMHSFQNDIKIFVFFQETGGSLDIPLQGQDPSTDFTATLNAMVYFPQYDVTAKSSDSIEAINPGSKNVISYKCFNFQYFKFQIFHDP